MKISTIVGLAASVIGSGSLWAQGVTISGQVQLTAPPGSLLPGAYESDTTADLFLENLDLVLPANVAVDASQPGTYNSRATLTPSELSAGTAVNDYYVHADPVASTGTVFAGSLTFAGDILGVIESTATLAATDAIFGTSGVVYAGALPGRGLELNPNQDYFAISNDGRTLNFQLTTWGIVDDLRIVTAVAAPQAGGNTVAPEPGTIFLGLLAIGAGLVWRRLTPSSPSKRY